MCYTNACEYERHTTGYDCECSKPNGDPCPHEVKMKNCLTCKHSDNEGVCFESNCTGFIRAENKCDCGQYLEERHTVEFDGPKKEMVCPECER